MVGFWWEGGWKRVRMKWGRNEVDGGVGEGEGWGRGEVETEWECWNLGILGGCGGGATHRMGNSGFPEFGKCPQYLPVVLAECNGAGSKKV